MQIYYRNSVEMFGASLKNNWSVKIGANFFAQSFSNRINFNLAYSAPNPEETVSEEYFFEDSDNLFSSYSTSFTLSYDTTSCNNSDPLLTNGKIINMQLLRENNYFQFGIPIKVEKLFGKNRNKLFLGMGIVPVFAFRATKKNGDGFISTTRIVDCDPDPADIVYRQINVKPVSSSNEQHILPKRLDLHFEIGYLYDINNSSFKASLFIENSVSGFTKVNDKKYQSQMVGVKFGLRKKVF